METQDATKSLRQRVVNWFCLLWALGLIAYTFMAYFIVRIDAQTGIYRDGLGRILHDVPLWASLFVLGIPWWPGPAWYAFDFAVFWLSVVAIIHFVKPTDENPELAAQ